MTDRMTDVGPVPSTPRVTVYVDYLGDEPAAPPPPPKRKRLTKEERLARQQKKQLEFRKLEIKDHLKREIALSKKTVAKGKGMWLEMGREIKVEQMQNELSAWKEKANRIMKGKDENIKLILDEIEETKRMQKRGFLIQLETLDYLKDVFSTIQDNLRCEYEKQCQDMVHDFYNITCEITEIQNTYVHKFHQKLNDTNESLERQLIEGFSKCLEKRNEAVNVEIVNRYGIRDDTTKKMYIVHNQLKDFVDALLNASLDVLKYDKVNYLMNRQRNFVIDFRKWGESEITKSRKLNELQKDLAQRDADHNHTINDLTQVHSYYRNVYRSIENTMERNRVDTHEKLMVLTSESYNICKTVGKIAKYGEHLLALATNCMKLQTQSEKVTLLSGFTELSLAEQQQETEEFKINIIDLKSHVDLSDEELLAHMQLLKHLWRRQALAEAQTVLLEERKRGLLLENQRYIDKIKSLSKSHDPADLQKTLQIKCILEEKPPCFSNPCV